MTTAAEISTLERLDRLESRIQIDELLSGYAFGCDRHDAERWLSVFSEDADWLIGGELGNPIGRDAIASPSVWVDSIAISIWRIFFDSADRLIALMTGSGCDISMKERADAAFVRIALLKCVPLPP